MWHVCEVSGSKNHSGLEAYPRQHCSSLNIGFFAFGAGAEVSETLNYLFQPDAGIDRNASGNKTFVPLLDRFNEIGATQADAIERALQPRCVAALVETFDADDDAIANPGWLRAV